MTTTPDAVADVGDAELIAAVRGGDTTAYATLYQRHVDAARRLARQLVTPADAEDLVAEAFTKVLGVLQRGGGPDVAFRAYLLTAVRRLHVDKVRASAKVHPTDDLSPFEPGVPFVDTAVESFDNLAAAEAFRSLPERWQVVLWHTEVEGQKPAEIAPLLGMTPNSVAALAYRAREGLRQAFLSQHAADIEDDSCRRAQQQLGGFVRDGLSRRDHAKVQTHLDDCRRCMGIYLELIEVNSGLAALLAPLLLGGTLGAAYLATVTTGAVGGAVGAGFLSGIGKSVAAGADRVKDLVAANVGLSVAASVVAVAAVSGIAVAGVTLVGGNDAPAAGRRPPVAAHAPSATTVLTSAPRPSGSTTPAGQHVVVPVEVVPASTPVLSPTPDPVAAPPVIPPTQAPPTAPTAPTTAPTTQPTTQPTTEPTTEPTGPTDPVVPSPTTRPSEPTATPTATAPPTMSPSPTVQPTPTHPVSPTSEPSPTLTPSPTATPRPTGDPVMSFVVNQQFYVNALLAGLPEGTEATVTLSFRGGGLATTQDSRCSRRVINSGQSITCTVRDDVPILVNTISAKTGSTLTATATVSGIDGDDTGNNSAQHTIGSASAN